MQHCRCIWLDCSLLSFPPKNVHTLVVMRGAALVLMRLRMDADLRGEANCWGVDPLNDVQGHCTEGLREEECTRLLLQNALWEVKHENSSMHPTHVVTMLAATQALGIADFGGEVKQLFPLRDDELKGPQWRSAKQVCTNPTFDDPCVHSFVRLPFPSIHRRMPRLNIHDCAVTDLLDAQGRRALELLRDSLEKFLGPEYPPCNAWHNADEQVSEPSTGSSTRAFMGVMATSVQCKWPKAGEGPRICRNVVPFLDVLLPPGKRWMPKLLHAAASQVSLPTKFYCVPHLKYGAMLMCAD